MIFQGVYLYYRARGVIIILLTTANKVESKREHRV